MNQKTNTMKKFILIQILFALGLPAFSQVYRKPAKIESPGYDSILNASRDISGSNRLERKAELDSYCKERCVRFIDILIKNPKYIVIEGGAEKESHREAKYSENFNIAMFQSRRVNPGFVAKFVNSSFDSSPGHHANRVDPRFKKFGEYSMTVVLKIPNEDYDPNKISNEFIQVEALITYEAFR